MKKFTVVICTYNRHFLIDKCLKNVLNNSIMPEKIIIIDQNYNFSTYNKIINLFNVKNYKNYLIIRNLIQRGLTKSKNFSLKHIDTQYVFFIDDDISLERNFFLVVSSQTEVHSGKSFFHSRFRYSFRKVPNHLS